MLEDDEEGQGIWRQSSLGLLYLLDCFLDGFQGAEHNLAEELGDLGAGPQVLCLQDLAEVASISLL